MNKLDLDTKIEEIKELVTTPDYDMIDKGVALARELNEPAAFEALLKDCRYDSNHTINVENSQLSADLEQPMIGNEMFPWIRESGTKNTNPYLEYALLNLIGYAHEDSQIDESIKKKNLTELFIWGTSFSQFPMGILELVKLKKINFLSGGNGLEKFTLGMLESENKYILSIPGEIEKLSQLESLSWSCNIDELPSSIIKLNNLKDLDLSDNNFETLPDFVCQMDNLESLWLCNNKLKSLPQNISEMVNLKDNNGLNIHANPFMIELLTNEGANAVDRPGFIGQKMDFEFIMGQTLYNWMDEHYGDNDGFYFIDVPMEPVDHYDGDAVIYGPLAATSQNADTPNYILRAISMFFREKENLGKTLLDNPNCPLGVLYDVIKGGNDELKEVAAKSPAVKKLKPAGFGRYADPETGEIVAKMQDGKLVAVEKAE